MSQSGSSRSALGSSELAAIAIGGVIGAALRWVAIRLIEHDSSGSWFAYAPNTSVVKSPGRVGPASEVPIDTLTVNLVGCLLLGFLTLLLVRPTRFPRRLLVAGATGLCGSLTTFSTFAVEVAEMLGGGAASPPNQSGATPALYLALSVIGGGLAFAIGRLLASRIVTTPGVVTIGGTR